MTRDPSDAIEPETCRGSTTSVTAILAAILIGALGLLLWRIVVGAPAGAGTIAVGDERSASRMHGAPFESTWTGIG